MIEWLSKIKGSISDSMAYDSLKANVESMQRDNESLKSHIELLKSQVEILTANLTESKSELSETRERLAVSEANITQLREVNAQLRINEEFDVSFGIAFKRGKGKGEYEKTPLCPTCHRPLSKLISRWGCSPCGYFAPYSPSAALSALKENAGK